MASRSGAATSLKHAVRRAQLLLGSMLLRGTGVECPVCRLPSRRFMTYRGRPGARCVRCGAFERHRLLGVFLQREGELEREVERTLHFAPEPEVERLVSRRSATYVKVDLAPGYDVRLDITELPFRDGVFERVLCCHVLEHIPDDDAAIAELRRVLGRDGVALVQVPIRASSPTTDEAPTLGRAERAARYGHADHVRLYGQDITERLARHGFTVDAVAGDEITPVDRIRWGIPIDETLLACTVPR